MFAMSGRLVAKPDFLLTVGVVDISLIDEVLLSRCGLPVLKVL